MRNCQRNSRCNCVRACYVICYVTIYVPDYVTVIHVLGSGTNEGSIPRSGCGRPPSLVPTNRGLLACLVRYAEAEGSAREGRATRVGEEEEGSLDTKFHRTVISEKKM